MKLFRTPEKPPYIPVSVSWIPPEPGTYPPRLLALSPVPMSCHTLSYWLRNEQRITIVKNVLWAERQGTQVRLIVADKEKHRVIYNGGALPDDCILQDGDYIRWRDKIRLIYQADPVKDRRERIEGWQIEGEPFVQPVISDSIQQWVRINPQGISLDGGETFARWDEIAGIYISFDEKSGLLHVYKDHEKKLNSKIRTFSKDEASGLLNWLRIASPFDLCWTGLSGSAEVYSWIMEAYWMAVVEKIYVPVENHQRQMPDNPDAIIAYVPRWKWWLELAATLACIVGLFTWGMTVVINPPNFIEEWFWLFGLLMFVTVSSIALMFFGYRVIAWGERLEQQKQQPKPKSD